ncbi:LLM class flavin-dependent oxidoreductase [Streptomyces roseus]|uniref:LLM class flavin-dependent oxidoreductase n=1 Tax=Streptomyces roseus TaxID=66430 RepID=UPI003684D9BC
MQLGVNVPNFGPGADPGGLRAWARVVEELGFDLLMVSDHVAVTPDVATRYPAPFGWARQEFDALGVPFTARGRLTDEHLVALRKAWHEERQDQTAPIPLWVGGNSEAGIRRAIRFGDAWHPLRGTLPWMRSVVTAHTLPAFAPRIALRLTTAPVSGPERLAGTGTLEQILEDLDELRRLGAHTVVLDPYHGDPEETRRPDEAWRALASVAAHWRTSS